MNALLDSNPYQPPWIKAVLVSAAIYIGAISVYFWEGFAEDRGAAVAPGVGGIEVSLGPAGRSAGAETVSEAAQEPVTQPEETVKPEPQPEPKPEPKPQPKAPPEPLPESLLAAKAEVLEIDEDVLEPELEEEEYVEEVPEHLAAPTDSDLGAGGVYGDTAHDDRGTGDNTAGGGAAGEMSSYTATLQAWLERHKEYPKRARRRRQEGTALLYFSMNRDGDVLDYRLEQSSGYPMLDEEVLEMIERAQPLPIVPESFPHQTLELIVPVEFFLR